MNQNFKPREINKIMLEFLVSSGLYALSILILSMPALVQFLSAKGMFNNEAAFNTFSYLFIFANILKPIAIIVFIKFLYDFIKKILIAISIYTNKNM